MRMGALKRARGQTTSAAGQAVAQGRWLGDAARRPRGALGRVQEVVLGAWVPRAKDLPAAPQSGRRAQARLVGLGTICFVFMGLCASGAALAERPAHDHTPGLDLTAPLTAFAESSAERGLVAVGSADGFVFLSRDRGQSWTRGTALVPAERSIGGFRAQGLTGDLETEPLDPGTVPSLRNYLSGIAPNESFNEVDDDELNLVFPRLRLFGPYEELLDFADDPTMEERDERGDRFGDGAPRLVSLARKRGFGERLVVDLSGVIEARAGNPTAIHALDLDPARPEVVLAATADGLRRSTDSGATWPTVLGAPFGPEAPFFALLRDARQPRRIWAGGDGGLFVSGDGGERFFALPEGAELAVRALAGHPSDPKTLLVGTTEGLLRTTDGGRSFETIFEDALPELASITALAFDPRQPARALVGTGDGLMRTEDGGKSFTRAGGLQFVGQAIRSVSASAEANQFLVSTADGVWESLDGGATWRMAWLGTTPEPLRQALVSPHGHDDVWVLSEAHLFRLSAQAAPVLTVFGRNAWDRLHEVEPSLEAVWRQTAARFGVETPVDQRRDQARWAHFLPQIVAGLYRFEVNLPGANREIYALGGPERFLSDTLINRQPQYFVFGSWDLAALLHDDAGDPWSDAVAAQRDLERRLRATVTALYQERRQLQLRMLTLAADQPAPVVLRSRLFQALRVEELTAQLNGLAGPVLPLADALDQVLGGR
jgi:photosystem II stability/assembly factor-like uncharacterized protein